MQLLVHLFIWRMLSIALELTLKIINFKALFLESRNFPEFAISRDAPLHRLHLHSKGNMTFLNISVKNSVFLVANPNFFHGLFDGWLEVPTVQVWPPQKSLIFGEKMLRLLEFFWEKNSSPIFSTMVRARASSPCILLIGTIKPYNFYYKHFLLWPFFSEIFAGPFHREKMIEQGKTVFSPLNQVLREWCVLRNWKR